MLQKYTKGDRPTEQRDLPQNGNKGREQQLPLVILMNYLTRHTFDMQHISTETKTRLRLPPERGGERTNAQ